jgi:hypothetical protein
MNLPITEVNGAHWGDQMIDASSSIASGILSGVFGTPAASSSGVSGASTDSVSTAAYILDGSLQSLGSGTSMDSFLANAIFAQATQALLLDPLANGKITGTPSANVQKLLSELDPPKITQTQPAAGTTNNSTSSTNTGTSTVSGLADGGIVA